MATDRRFHSLWHLQGEIIRKTRLSKDHQGPRDVLNAVERLASGYGKECDQLRQDLNIGQSQLRDYHSRLGKPFAQASYLSELTTLRDQLKTSLSATTSQSAGNETDSAPSSFELARQVSDLKHSFQAEATPERLPTKSIATEVPVTLRIRQRDKTPIREYHHPAPVV